MAIKTVSVSWQGLAVWTVLIIAVTQTVPLAIQRNRVMMQMRNGILARQTITLTFSPCAQLSIQPSADEVDALRLDYQQHANKAEAQYRLLSVYIATGSIPEAAQLAAIVLPTDQPLVFVAALTALSCNGQHNQVISAAALQPSSARTLAMSETIGLAWLHQNNVDMAKRFLPDDIFVNMRLWQIALQSGDTTVSNRALDQLRYFPKSALQPLDDRLVDFLGLAIPELISQKIWTNETALRACSYLVWTKPLAIQTESLIQNLAGRYPQDLAWQRLRQELEQRRKGSTTTASDEMFLTQVAASLNVNRDKIELGEDMLPFSSNDFWFPQTWSSSVPGAFAQGADPFAAPAALRLFNFWQRPFTSTGQLGYNEYIGRPLLLKPNTTYVLSLRYKTDLFEVQAPLIALLDYGPNPQWIFTHELLPQTNHEWRDWFTVVTTPANTVPLRPILRNWGQGDVTFDAVRLRELNLRKASGETK